MLLAVRVSASCPLPPCPQPLAGPTVFLEGRAETTGGKAVEYTLDSSIYLLRCCKKSQPTSLEQHRHICSQFWRSEAQKQGVSRRNGILLQAPGENSFLCLFQLPGAIHTPGLMDLSSSPWELIPEHKGRGQRSSVSYGASLERSLVVKPLTRDQRP